MLSLKAMQSTRSLKTALPTTLRPLTSAKTFKADPAKYAPQYGGFCAYAVALGKKFDGDPRYADIVDGKLYLFVNEEIFKKYKKDSKRILAKAERTWPRIEHKAVGDL